MSNLPQQIARNQYVADGITTVYNYTFLVPSANSLVNDIAVYVTVAGDAPDPDHDIQPLNTAYTVQGAGVVTGGTITFQPGYVPPISSIVTIVRNMYVGIDTDFAVAQNFNGANLDLALERLVLIMQEYFTGLQYTTLTYPINAILPTQELNLLPQLLNNNVWIGLNGGVVQTELVQNIPLNTLSHPFTLTNTSVTTTGAQLNYLNFATGTTGTGELVYSNGATLQNATLVNPVISGLTFSGVTINSSTLNQPSIYQPVTYGVTDGSNAAAGTLGEVMTASVASGAAVSLTTVTDTNVCHVNLTAGDWDVTGLVRYTNSSTTCYQLDAWASTVSATAPTNRAIAATASADLTVCGLVIPTLRVNVTTTTTVYLGASASFSDGAVAAFGEIYARRVR